MPKNLLTKFWSMHACNLVMYKGHNNRLLFQKGTRQMDQIWFCHFRHNWRKVFKMANTGKQVENVKLTSLLTGGDSCHSSIPSSPSPNLAVKNQNTKNPARLPNKMLTIHTWHRTRDITLHPRNSKYICSQLQLWTCHCQETKSKQANRGTQHKHISICSPPKKVDRITCSCCCWVCFPEALCSFAVVMLTYLCPLQWQPGFHRSACLCLCVSVCMQKKACLWVWVCVLDSASVSSHQSYRNTDE